MKTTITRHIDGHICAYRISSDLDEPLGLMEPAATYRVKPESNEKIDEILHHHAAPDLGHAVYTTRNSVVCIGRNGDLLWCYELEPHSTVLHGHIPDCVFSLDGTMVWVYRPDAIANRGDDKWVVLSADTGEVVAEVFLGTVGHAGRHVQHPDGRHVLLDVGEGQDGTRIFRATVTGDHFDFYMYEWVDRVLMDIGRDGRYFMTVPYTRLDVAFHAFPDGEVVLRRSLAEFGYEYDDDNEDYADKARIDYIGGFLDPHIAVVVVSCENDDDEEWRHYHRVDLRTGTVLGRFEAHSQNGYDFEPLGDGTWITSGPDGKPVRHR